MRGCIGLFTIVLAAAMVAAPLHAGDVTQPTAQPAVVTTGDIDSAIEAELRKADEKVEKHLAEWIQGEERRAAALKERTERIEEETPGAPANTDSPIWYFGKSPFGPIYPLMFFLVLVIITNQYEHRLRKYIVNSQLVNDIVGPTLSAAPRVAFVALLGTTLALFVYHGTRTEVVAGSPMVKIAADVPAERGHATDSERMARAVDAQRKHAKEMEQLVGTRREFHRQDVDYTNRVQSYSAWCTTAILVLSLWLIVCIHVRATVQWNEWRKVHWEAEL